MLSSSERSPTLSEARGPTQDRALLDVRGVSKSFGGVVALEEVDLQVGPGEVLGLVGANGSGKSTLSRIIVGEIRPDAGKLWVEGELVARHSPKEAKRLRVIMAHQHPSLAPHFPVWESIFLGLEVCSTGGFVARRRAQSQAAEILRSIGANIDPEALCGSLTAAGQQWVEIARAVSRRPRLLILDEPTASLTGPEVASLFAAVQRLTATGVGIIFISHRLQEVEKICGRILVLRNGRGVGSWSTSGTLDIPRILDLMVGDSEAKNHTPVKRTVGAPILSLESANSGDKVQNVSFTLRRGEVLGIAGLQGQGQEEVLEAIAGLRSLDDGYIRFKDESLRPRNPREMIRRGICFVPNDRARQGLFVDADVGANLGYVAVSFDKRPWLPPPKSLRALVETIIERLMIKTRGPQQMVATLSGGNQQKVVVGKWLSMPIEVLLLSDPTKGVDVHARTEIHALVRELVAADRAAIFFASDVQELLLHCDRILVMYEGRITAILAGDEMNEHRIAAASFGHEIEATRA